MVLSSFEDYIQLTNVNLKGIKDNNKISKKKKVNIFEYGETNIYSDGDTLCEGGEVTYEHADDDGL